MAGYTKPGYSPIGGAELCLLDENGKAESLLKEGNKIITDEEGNLEITFDAAGTYYLTAKADSFKFRIVMPWCKIDVAEDKPVVKEEDKEIIEEKVVKPTEDNVNDNEEKQIKSDGTVKTGDSFNITIFVTIMLLSAAGICIVVLVRRKVS